MSGSTRASTAAFSFFTISSFGMTDLPSKWPQRFGYVWSSSMMALAPARSRSCTVRRAFSALPKPVSASARMQMSTTSRVAATWAASSVTETRPMSGTPR